MRKPFFILCLFLLFSSCEDAFRTVVDYDIPHTPAIVIDLRYPHIDIYQFSNRVIDSNIMSVTSTMKVTGKDTAKPIESVRALLYENNIVIDSFIQTSDGYYYCPFKSFSAGKVYKLIAKAPGFDQVKAIQTMPQKPNVVSKKLTPRAAKLKEYETLIDYDKVEIELQDNQSTTDYYRLSLINPHDPWFNNQWECKQTSDPVFEPVDTGEPINIDGPSCVWGNLYFRDVSFNGKKKKLTVFYPSRIRESSLNKKLYISIEGMSEAAYNYYRSHELYWNNDGNPFAEPTRLYSNVKNGYGVFSLTNTVVDSL